MSGYSAVDDAADPRRLIAFVDDAVWAESGMKHYAAVTLAGSRPVAPILDVGCGTGHDLVLLHRLDVGAIGVDPSARMLDVAKRRAGGSAPLVQASGERLPFQDESFGGARVERVLMHVADPGMIVAEIARCLAPGAVFTLFEPDWSNFRVRAEHGDEVAGWLVSARHPAIGSHLWSLVEAARCEVLDRVEELSVWRSLDILDRVVGGVDGAVHRAIDSGRIDRSSGERWLHEQRARDDRGEYLSFMPKVMVVARVP